MLYSTREARQKNKTFLFEGEFQWLSLREETNSPSSVASLPKLSTLSVLVLDEQQKSSYAGNQTCPIMQKRGAWAIGSKYNHILLDPLLQYQIPTNPWFIFLMMPTAEFETTVSTFTVLYLFLLAIAPRLYGWQPQSVFRSVQTEISQQLLDGLSWNFSPVRMTSLIPWLFM